jgi:hypothetical protein
MRKPREYVGQWAVVGGAQRDPLRGGHGAAMLRRDRWSTKDFPMTQATLLMTRRG